MRSHLLLVVGPAAPEQTRSLTSLGALTHACPGGFSHTTCLPGPRQVLSSVHPCDLAAGGQALHLVS